MNNKGGSQAPISGAGSQYQQKHGKDDSAFPNCAANVRSAGWNPPRKHAVDRSSNNGERSGDGSSRQFFPEPTSRVGQREKLSGRLGSKHSPKSSRSAVGEEPPPRFFASPLIAATGGPTGKGKASEVTLAERQRAQQFPITSPPIAASGGPTGKGKASEAVFVPRPASPATEVQKRHGVCSIWTINVKKGQEAYRYDVNIERVPMMKRNGQLDKGRSLVKGADDGQRALHRNLCLELITIAFKKTKRFGMNIGDELVYNKDCLYASCPINDFDLSIENHEVNDYVKTYCGEGKEVCFTIRITENRAAPVLALDDFKQYSGGESAFCEDRSLRTFLEMATSQFALNKGFFVSISTGKLFEIDDAQNQNLFREKMGNGIVLRAGLAKGVRVIKNGDRAPKAAVVLDTKVAAFFEANSLIDTIFDILPRRNSASPSMHDFSPSDWVKVERLLQDLRVEVSYRRVRTFELGKLTEKPLRDLFIDVERDNGGPPERMSIPQYFFTFWKIQLKFVDFPGVIPNNPIPAGKKAEVFPLELLDVMEDQRVPREKTDSKLMDQLLRFNSMPPNERMKAIWDRARALGLFTDENPVLRAFGLNIDQKSNQVVVGVRSLPQICFKRNTLLLPDAIKGEWRRDASRAEYLAAEELDNWLVLCARPNTNLVKDFVRRLCEMGRDKGIRMAEPEIVSFDSPENSDQEWMAMFERCTVNRIQFILLVDERRKDTHGLLKLSEAIHKVTTQHITLEKALDVVKKNQRQTLENILNKLNMKNFGLNYVPIIEQSGKRFALETGDVLVLGYDVAHPAPMSAQTRRMLAAQGESQLSSLDPSCVGICANMATDPHSFVGDYFFQEARREAIDGLQLTERMKWILHNLDKHRPSRNRPKYIFVFRDGLSEGQFAMACKKELMAIKEGCRQFDSKYKPKFVMVIGTKRHFKKFFIEEESREGGRPFSKNLYPGTIIQEKCRADITEFFLQPHAPLKGTGKPVEYAMLENEIGVKMDELQGLIMALSYSHQIVNMAVSMPEPVYQADELAKRGKNNFVALKRFKPNQVPKKEHRLLAKKGAKRQTISLVDHHELNRILSYWGDGTFVLSNRFTA
ncbi:hypothetical protein niasHT_011240 [Heterodera trifolii]|uniref:Piwi domain-containing protein n=1 Tax=Heterodera trifolii TaxID=157864 RepID=A0ABD2L660_9BILA